MKIVTGIAVVMVLCCLVMTGCGKSESAMVGKWVGNSGSFEFYKDKTGVVTPAKGRPDLPASAAFQWSMEGSGEVRIYLPAAKRTVFGKLEGKTALIVEDDRFLKQQ